MTSHLAVRPSWICSGCGADWPCATRRGQLRAEFATAQMSLSLYLAACMVDAAYDQPRVSAGVLYSRFLGWTGLHTGRPFAP